MKAGDSVIWYVDRYKNDPHIGYVTRVNSGGSLDLAIFVSGSVSLLPRIGVHHADMPNKEIIDNADAGCWDVLPDPLVERIADIEAKMEDALQQINLALEALTKPGKK